MNKKEEKLEKKSPAKPGIKQATGTLDDKDVEKVTGGAVNTTRQDPYKNFR